MTHTTEAVGYYEEIAHTKSIWVTMGASLRAYDDPRAGLRRSGSESFTGSWSDEQINTRVDRQEIMMKQVW